MGSDHKDIVDSAQGKVIGAWLNSSDHAARHDVATLGGPRSKFYRSDATVILESSLDMTYYMFGLFTLGAVFCQVFLSERKNANSKSQQVVGRLWMPKRV